MNYQIIYEEINKLNKNKYKYNIYETILRLIDIDINLCDRNLIKERTHIFKIKLANDLITHKIYKKFNFNLKKQKNFIYNYLTSQPTNSKINYNIIKYISIYLNLNILIIKNNLYNFINDYNENINTLIIIDKMNSLFNGYNYKNKTIFNNKEITELLKFYKKNYEIIIDDNIEFDSQFNKIKKYDLDTLYNVCNFYNINIYDNYNKIKKKSKAKLYEELYNILNNI